MQRWGKTPAESKAGSCHPPSSSSSSWGAAAAPSPPGREQRWEAHNPALACSSSHFLRHSKIWPEPLFCSTPLLPWLDACLIVYLFISVFSQLPAHTGAGRGGGGGGEAKAGSQGGPKKKLGRGQVPPFPRGWEETGKCKADREGGGSRGQEGGTPAASPTPFALCARLGKLKIAASKEWLQAPQRAC